MKIKRIVDDDDDYCDQGNFCTDCFHSVHFHWYIDGVSQYWCGHKKSFVSPRGTCQSGFLRKPRKRDCVFQDEEMCPYQKDSVGKSYRDKYKSCWCYLGEFTPEAMKRYGLIQA